MEIPTITDPQLLVKVGSIIIHIQEMLSPTGHAFDAQVLKQMVYENDVVEWLIKMDALALLPKKR